MTSKKSSAAPARASLTAEELRPYAKSIDEQIRDCEACIDRVKLASERLWQTSDGAKKRFLDAEECKVLSQLANAESRAHGELRELRIAKVKQPEPPVDEAQLETQAIEFLRGRGWKVDR